MRLDIVPAAEWNTSYHYEVSSWTEGMSTVREFARRHRQTKFTIGIDGECIDIEWLKAPTAQAIG